MPPAAFILLTFGIWTLVKGEIASYWALATTPNASKGASGTPSSAGASVGAAVGALAAPSSPAAPAAPTVTVPPVAAAPNVIGNSVTI
jgi:hypothetical protein